MANMIPNCSGISPAHRRLVQRACLAFLALQLQRKNGVGNAHVAKLKWGKAAGELRRFEMRIAFKTLLE